MQQYFYPFIAKSNTLVSHHNTSEFTIEFHCFVEFNPDQFTQINSKFIADFN